MNSPKVVVEGLCKVFGTSPKEALAMLAGRRNERRSVLADRSDCRRS